VRGWGACAPARIFVFALATLLVGILPAFSADLKGRVVNGTTGRFAAGDEVVLIRLSSNGMSETADTRTDSTGRFRLPVDDPETMHVVRVMYEGISYHQVVPAAAHAVAIEVYDVTAKLEDMSAIMDVERFEAAGDRLEVKELVTMRNDSRPPRTLIKDRSFEFELPPEAEVEYGLVQVGEEKPLKQKPIPGDHAGQYYFAFPMRPGDTRFAVAYRIPYAGKVRIEPTIRNRHERFVVMLPKSMKFEPIDGGVFRPMPDATSDNVQGTAPVALDSTVSFRISGRGMLTELEGRAQPTVESETTSMPRPGGGIGAPIGTPDPLQRYRWLILGGISLMLLVGALVATQRQRLPRAGVRPVSRKVEARQIPKQKAKNHTSVSRNLRHGQRSHTSRMSTHK
jgi:5-hydroxyisourate hydrolase-like protein (transthyretin family)